MLQAYYKGTNEKVRCGDTIYDFRKEEDVFTRATRKTEIGKSGKVCTNKGEYYASVFNLEVREYDEYEEKTIFVMDELKPLLQEIDERISNVRYENSFWDNGKIKRECIIIDFINRNQKIIDVTCNSLKAIALQVIREI